jgi:SPP1 gp7 family putative phage head morphogenesis protein
MTKNEKYWQARTAQRMWEHMQSAEETADQVAKVYAKASLYLSREMQDIFKKYVEKHHLTEKEALQLLNTLRDRTSIEELRQRLQSSSQKQEIADLLAELEAPAYQARIQRLQELQTQIDLVMQQVYKQEQAITTAHYIQLAEEAYNRSIFDIQQRTGFGFSFSHIDQKQVDKVLKSKWSGMNYSERVWRNTRAVAQEVKEALLVNLITGRTERETAEMLTKKFAGGSSKARRLIRTESCYLSNQLEMESYKECGVEKYRYLATLDLRTSEICRELDGKVFLVKDQQPGKNCPPMHPWCRSTTIAVISEKSLNGMKRRARDPVTGKTYLVPASMNYREWYAKYVAGQDENYEKGISNKRVPKEDEYRIDKKIIETNEYKRKFSGITGNSIVDESIYKYAKAGLMHRDGTDREDLYIISASKGVVLGKNVTSDEAFGVKPNESIRNAVINNQGDLIGLHTHPDGTPPTGSDFETAFKRGYHLGIVACSNGSVYTYGCANQFASARIIDDTIEKFKKMIDDSGKKVYPSDREAHLAAIKSLGKDYGIWYETR